MKIKIAFTFLGVCGFIVGFMLTCWIYRVLSNQRAAKTFSETVEYLYQELQERGNK